MSLLKSQNVHLVLFAFVFASVLVLVGWLPGKLVESLSPRVGSISVDADSNLILDIFTIERGANVYRTKYRDPASFDDYVFVFDPSNVQFDSYSVSYVMRKGARNGGMRSDQGVVFPNDATKRMISLVGSAGVPSRRYTQPSSSRASNFMSATTTQFFYTRGSRSEEDHRDALDKFRALETAGQFMVKRGGSFVPVAISKKPYR